MVWVLSFRAASADTKSRVLMLFGYAQTALNADATFEIAHTSVIRGLLPTILWLWTFVLWTFDLCTSSRPLLSGHLLSAHLVPDICFQEVCSIHNGSGHLFSKHFFLLSQTFVLHNF